MVMARLAGTIFTSEPSFTATVVFLKVGMKSPTGSSDADLAFLHQRKHRRAGDGLAFARRCGRSYRVVIRRPASLSLHPNGVLVHRLAVAEHQRDRARNLVLIRVALQQLRHALEPLLR